MKKLIILPLLVLLFGAAMGQDDLLILKDGSVIRGTISEYRPNDKVRIRDMEGKFQEFPGSEVKKVSFKGEKSMFSLREKGYYNVTSFGLLFGVNSWGEATAQPSLQMVQGFQFKGRMNAGIGTGLEVIQNSVVLPAFGEFRYHLKKDGFSPFVAANAGYNVLLASGNYYWASDETKSKGGIMTGLQVGIRNYAKQNLGWSLSLGYRYQQMSTTYPLYLDDLQGTFAPVPVTERTSMNRIEMRFGLLFH